MPARRHLRAGPTTAAPGPAPSRSACARSGRTPALVLAAVVALVLTPALAACGSGEGRTALAVERAVAVDGGLRLRTECADGVQADVADDPAGSGLVEVTLWGRPRIGRCHPEVRVALPTPTTRFVDGATSMVIDVDPA